MNINKNRPTDNQILKAIKQGKSQLHICKTLNTHTQRISALVKRNGFEFKRAKGGYGIGEYIRVEKKYSAKTLKKETTVFRDNFSMIF